LAYFTSAATWNYLTVPFVFTYEGVAAHEVGPWDEDGATWRRLAVTFPPGIANHNPDQVFYYDEQFMLRRMDYSPAVTGSPRVAHYTHDPQTFDGFVFPTRRRVHLYDEAGHADQSFAPITLDVERVTVHRDQHNGAQPGRGDKHVDMKLEVAVLPVSDVDRSKAFYASLGWREDADFVADDGLRVVQLTPPGSEASIIFGDRITAAAPGSVEGLQLTVSDIQAARDELAGHGVDVSPAFHDVGGIFHHAGTEGRAVGPAPEHADYGSFASFSDPDGNGWLLQEVKQRAPGR
jgi:catechol 2,3-dioxygenase-like lactoylglutathione lyase family enzyme